MRKTETLNLRVSAEFKSRLVEEARKEKRSVTNYLESTLARVWRGKPAPRKNRNHRKVQDRVSDE